MWDWYAVPIFALPALSIPQAIGVACIVGLLTNQYYATPEGKTWERMQFMFAAPLSVLVVGWLAKQWMTP